MGRFKVGIHVGWTSEAGPVNGKIVKAYTRNFDYKGYTHHASNDEPQYEIRSDKVRAHRRAQGLGAAQGPSTIREHL
jgi:hypothetical protein